MLKISYAGGHGLSPVILSQFTLKMCVTTRNHKKFTKTAYFWCSRWFKVIIVDTFMISSMSVPICNRLHAIRANGGKISLF